MTLDPRSEEKLLGVRPELVKVIREAATRTKFRVTEGLRTPERQKMLVAQRKSKTMASRHITGHAIDFISIGEDGVATYDDDDMRRVADVIQAVADEQGVRIERGIDWGWDSPHIELHRKTYPAKDISLPRKMYEVARDHPKTTVTTVAVAPQVAEEVAPVAEVATNVATTAKDALSTIPAPIDLSAVQGWAGVYQWATDNPFVTGVCVLWVGVVWFWPKIKNKWEAIHARFA
jgi:hypothetical protein